MKALLTKNYTVPTSQCDNKGKLSFTNIFTVFIDLACEHAEHLNMGACDLAPKNLFWVAVKTKIKIHRRPEILKELEASTWPEEPGRIRCNRYYTLKENGELLCEGKTEWAMINTATGRPARVNEAYNQDIEHLTDTVCEEPYAKTDEDFTDCEVLAEYKVKSTDIDIGQHMNNIAYIRALFGVFSCAEIEALNIKEIDISYRLQCYEGEILTIKQRKTDNIIEIGFIKDENKTATTVRIKCE